MAKPEEFDVRAEMLPDGSVVVEVSGELDMAASLRFEDAIASAAQAPHVVIDLSDCTFLDSSGIRALAMSARAASERGARLDLVASEPAVLRVLEITGVDTIAPVHASREAVL